MLYVPGRATTAKSVRVCRPQPFMRMSEAHACAEPDSEAATDAARGPTTPFSDDPFDDIPRIQCASVFPTSAAPTACCRAACPVAVASAGLAWCGVSTAVTRYVPDDELSDLSADEASADDLLVCPDPPQL